VTWIKICGTTSLEDALLAAEAGADALGFIFAESPRRIEPQQAQQIIAKLPSRIERVGVFVDPSAEYVYLVALQTGITRIQLHGDEDADLLRRLRESLPSLRITKTVNAGNAIQESLRRLNGSAFVDSVLLDSGSISQRGGTGRVFDWHAAKAAIAQSGVNLHWIIAGGLTPENVGEAIRLFHPWGVDVVSGVESRPGRKDAGKLKNFIAAVRAAEEKS